MLNLLSNKNDSIYWIYLAGVLFFTSVFFLPLTLDHTLIPRFFSASFFLLLISFFLFKNQTKYSFPEGNILFVLLIFFYAINFNSVLWAVNFSEAILECQKVFIGVVVFFYTIFFAGQHTDFEKNISKIVMLIVFIGVTTASIQLFQVSDWGGDNLYSVTSIFSNKNLFTSILFLFLPFLIYGIISFENRWRWAFVVSIILNVLMILIIQTRAVWMGLLGALILFFPFYFIKFRHFFSVKILLKFFLILIIVVGIVLIIFWFKGNLHDLAERWKIFGYLKSKTGLERIQIWEKTICFFKLHWQYGVGTGNWQIYFPSCSVEGLWRVEHDNLTYQRPHNDFLWVLSELGILGCLPLLIIFMVVYFQFGKIIFSKKKNEETLSLIIYAVGFIGYLIISFFDFPKERIDHIIFGSTLLGILFFKINQIEPFEKFNFQIKNSYLLIAIIVLCSLNIFIGIHRIKGEFFTKKIYSYKQVQNWKKVIENSDKAYSAFYTLDPTSVPIHWYRGLANFHLKNYPASLEDLKKAYQLNPYNMHVLNNLGSSYEMTGMHEEAEKMYLEANRISPAFEDPKFNLAVLFYKAGNNENALKWVNAVENDSERKQQFLKAIQIQMNKKNSDKNQADHHQ